MTAIPLYAIQAFSVPKHGHTQEENEDAVAYDAIQGWFAVADGATEASYSREWAQLLAKSLAPSTHMADGLIDRLLDRFLPERRFNYALQSVQKSWYAVVPWDRLKARGWLFMEKARQGAFATFLSVRVKEARWSALGIGDCNLFLVNETGKLRLSVPAQNATTFGTSPSLVPSIPGPAVKRALKASWRKAGKWTRGERLVICTDAVAAYLLRAGQADPQVWNRLLAVHTLDEFAAWVDRARESGMRNDDSTVAIVTLTDGLAGPPMRGRERHGLASA